MSNAKRRPSTHAVWFPRILFPALATLALVPPAVADFAKLAARLPAETDAVVAVDVEKLLASPRAASEKWDGTTAEAWTASPIMVPPGATRVLVGIGLKAEEMDAAWEVSLAEMKQVPALQALVDAEAGYIDRLWDKDAVCSPVGAYFVPLDAHTFASVTPVDRKATVSWIRQPASEKPPVKSSYIAGALAGLTKQPGQVMMALDLDGAVAMPVIRRRLDEANLPELKDKDPNAVARVLASVTGVTFVADVGDKISGSATVHFGEDAAPIAAAAKPLALTVLRNHGMNLDELEKWTYSVSGKTLTARGELTTQSLRKLLWLVQSPMPAATVPGVAKASAESTPAKSPGDKPVDSAQASLCYYKSICTILDSFSPGASASATATWFRKASKRVDQLPIRGVDPELVKWGSTVSEKMKELAGDAYAAQTQINARVAGERSADYGYIYYDDYYGYYSGTDRAQQRAYQESRAQASRKVSLEQRAQAQQEATRVLNDVVGMRQKVRADMVAKYGIEF